MTTKVQGEPPTATTVKDRAASVGEKVDEVVLQVDYQIIEHFSENLYGSPNKAVEELVANGFDAFATEVDVFIPGRFTPDRLLVWDNGESMDVEGLKALWWIARSPKGNGDRIEERDGRTRKMIGKFGIGKLASYSVGRVISHLCRHGNEFYLVSVDYALIHGDDTTPASYDHPITAPIIRLEEEEAYALSEGLFAERPTRFDAIFGRRTWTLAIVEDLKIEDLPQGRLMWVLGNGMPLRPDFAIRVNEELVEPKLAKKATVEWDFGSEPVLRAIRSAWDDAVRKDRFDPIQEIGSWVGLDPMNPDVEVPFVRFANLGLVWGTVRLFDETLLKYRSADQGRSHGFFLVVRGRLINPDDPALLHGDPSFETFYRSQFILNADDLDAQLLADRERLRSNAATAELSLLQGAIYRAARVEITNRDQQIEDEQSTHSILPVRSRPFYREPLNALLMRVPPEEVSGLDPARPKVERTPVGEDEPLADIDFGNGAFRVNTSHPFIRAVEKRLGKSKASREFLRAIDLFAVSERLLEGHLYEIGFHEDEVQEVLHWRDGLFRQMARAYDAPSELINEMYRTSYLGDRPFEKALHDVFEDMGFVAQHDGDRGKKDVLVIATVGPESYSFTVEAKGSKGAVSNKDAAVSAAANHRDKVGADHALIIAREFVGFGPDRDEESAAVLDECRSTGGVSIMELDALAQLHHAVDRFCYPLPTLRDVFLGLETPAAKLRRVAALVEPTEGFDYGALLREIWKRQGSEAQGQTVPYKAVYQQGEWRASMTFEEFERKLLALDTLAAGRIQVLPTPREVYLRQSPEQILAQIERSLQGDGHDMSGTIATPDG